MSTLDTIWLTLKVLAARSLRMRIKVTDRELDTLLRVSAGDPELRYLLEDVLAARR